MVGARSRRLCRAVETARHVARDASAAGNLAEGRRTVTVYAIHATIRTHGSNGFTGSVSVPTFYLDSRVQGIVSAEHAAGIAAGIVNTLGRTPREDVDIKACRVDPAREDAELTAFARETAR